MMQKAHFRLTGFDCVYYGLIVDEDTALTLNATATAEMSHKKWIRAVSNFFALTGISSRSICQMLANFS